MKWAPSNACEFMDFVHGCCGTCARDDDCPIFLRGIDAAEGCGPVPDEWVVDGRHVTCTGWEKRS